MQCEQWLDKVKRKDKFEWGTFWKNGEKLSKIKFISESWTKFGRKDRFRDGMSE